MNWKFWVPWAGKETGTYYSLRLEAPVIRYSEFYHVVRMFTVADGFDFKGNHCMATRCPKISHMNGKVCVGVKGARRHPYGSAAEEIWLAPWPLLS
jgi:hypothetical protein